MTLSENDRNYDQNEADGETPHAGEEDPRGVEKPGGFFSLSGAPCTALTAEKPGGFFSGPPSGEEVERRASCQLAPSEQLRGTGQAGSFPHDEPEELLQKLAAPVPWKRGGRPPVLTPEVREQICKLLSVGLSRRQVGAYLNIDPTTITHAAARDEEFARELARAEELVQVPAMMSLVAASRKNWRAAISLLNRKKEPTPPLSEEEKRQKHQERLEAVKRKSEITRLQNLMDHEEVLEKVARNKAYSVHEKAEQERLARIRAENERLSGRRKRGKSAPR